MVNGYKIFENGKLAQSGNQQSHSVSIDQLLKTNK
jgi:hypothetical protein